MPRIRAASFILKSLRNTPRSGNHQHQGLLFQEEGVPDDGLPREDRTTWFVAGSRQRAARRADVSAHMALDSGVDCRCRGDHRLCWGAADPSNPLGPPQSAAQVGPPQTPSRLSNRRYREERIREVLFSVYPQIHSGGTQRRGAEGPHRIRHRFANLHGRQRGFEATGSAVQGDREPVVKYASRAIKRIN
jgi:hypothetical protein